MRMKNISAIHRNKILAFVGLGFAVLFWAINAVVAKGVIAQVNPMALSFFRWMAALVFIFPFALKGLKKDRVPIQENLGILFFMEYHLTWYKVQVFSFCLDKKRFRILMFRF